MRHLVYPLQTVLDDSLGCAIWFAALGKGTNYIYENGELVKMEESYTSNTKVCTYFSTYINQYTFLNYLFDFAT